MSGLAGETAHDLTCDECERSTTKCKRLHRGRCFCPTCYTRMFQRRRCPRCGQVARLHRYEPEAVCRACEKAKPCARCGKTEYRIGRITPYGPVCNPCARYFQNEETCELCGKQSRGLTRASWLGANKRVCQTCAQADREICPACHRHRRLWEAEGGRRLCKKCLEEGEVPCPGCGEMMPAGRGNQCESCYTRGLLHRRIEQNRQGLSTATMEGHFAAFAAWLEAEADTFKAAMTINKYLPFFQELESRWGAIPEYQPLVEALGAERLRRNQMVMRWMEERGLVVVDKDLKEADSERRRIAQTLVQFPKGSEERRLLEGFYQEMAERMYAGQTSLRSVRLALSPTAKLLTKAQEMERIPPDQKVLDAQLKVKPGHRSAISGFVGYLRRTRGLRLVLPKASQLGGGKTRHQKLEEEMLALMEKGDPEQDWRRWITVGLAYFHGLPMKVGRNIGKRWVRVHADGSFTVEWERESYWIPGKVEMESQVP